MRDRHFVYIDFSFDRLKPFQISLALRSGPAEEGKFPTKVDPAFVREIDKLLDAPEITALVGADDLLPEEGAKEIANSLPEEAKVRPLCPGTIALILEEMAEWYHRDFLNVHLSEVPASADDYNNRGCAREEFGDLEGALSDYSKAIALDPLDPTPRLNRARLLINQGKFEEATKDLDEIYSLVKENLVPFSVVYLLNLAQTYTKCGEREKAVKTARLFAKRLEKYCPNHRTQVGDFIHVIALGSRLILSRDEVEEALKLANSSESR